MLYTMYTVEKAAESCLVCQFPGYPCHHVALEMIGWKKNKKVEKQKITREDFDLIVKHYLGLYINELMCDDWLFYLEINKL